MSKQPEALRLADGNDECAKAWLESSDAHKFRKDTASELRRLHAINAELVEALKACDEAMSYMSEYDIPLTLPAQVKSAIRKAEGREA